MATTAEINALGALYAGYFNRAPDPAGLQFWINEIDGGRDFNTIAADFAASPEAEALYPYLTTPGVSSPAVFVTEIYANLFGRTPDEAGLEFWTGVLADGTVSVADFIEAIILGARDDEEADPATFDKTVLDNKVEVGLDFADKAANQPGFVYDDQAAAAAVGVLSEVDETDASVEAAKAESTAFITGGTIPGGGLEGTTFTLTDTADDFTGTASDDTFQGILDADGDNSTFTAFDTMNGVTGTDTFNLLLEESAGATGTTDTPAGFALSNMDVVNLVSQDGTVVDNDGGILDASEFNATQVWQVDAFNGNVLAAAGQAVGFRGVDGSVNVEYEDGATAATIALDGLTGNFDIDVDDETDPSLTSITVAGNADDDGDEFTDDLYIYADGEDIATVNLAISSDSSIEVEEDDAEQISTVDASGSTGDLFLLLDDLEGLESVTGGSGSEFFDIVPDESMGLTISMGAGNDFLTIDLEENDNFNAIVVMNGDAGADTFLLDYMGNIYDASEAEFENGIAEIADFSVSEDVLDLTGSDGDFGQLSNTALANIAAEATLYDAVQAAAFEIDALGFNTAVFDYDGDVYVFNDEDGNDSFDDGDGLVKVTGISTDDLDASNFIT